MSTTFGISIDLIEHNQEELDCKSGEWKEDNFHIVAYRGNKGQFYWHNEIAKYLNNDIKVYALDNDPQGIFTIGDIKANHVLF